MAQVIYANNKRKLPDGLTIEQARQNFTLLDEKSQKIFEIVCKSRKPTKVAASRASLSYSQTQFLLARAVRVIQGKELPPERKKREEKPKAPSKREAIADAILTDNNTDLPGGLNKELLRERYSWLSLSRKKIFELRYKDGLLVKEIAWKLQVTKACVHARLYYAFKILNGSEEFLTPNERIKKRLLELSRNKDFINDPLYEKWRSLPPERRHLLIARFLDEKTVTTIAREKGSSTSPVFRKIREALQYLELDVRGGKRKAKQEALSEHNSPKEIQIFPN